MVSIPATSLATQSSTSGRDARDQVVGIRAPACVDRLRDQLTEPDPLEVGRVLGQVGGLATQLCDLGIGCDDLRQDRVEDVVGAQGELHAPGDLVEHLEEVFLLWGQQLLHHGPLARPRRTRTASAGPARVQPSCSAPCCAPPGRAGARGDGRSRPPPPGRRRTRRCAARPDHPSRPPRPPRRERPPGRCRRRSTRCCWSTPV